MKTPFILLSLLFAELLCAQQPRIMLQTNSADYFEIKGKSGEKVLRSGTNHQRF